MKSVLFLGFLCCGLFLSAQIHVLNNFQLPIDTLTPGAVCTASDPDLLGYSYIEKIARCNRNISLAEKLQVAHAYGDIPQSNWNNYEFDHLIPLCAGGSNDIANLWPQPLDQAKKKDVIELEVCKGLRDGTVTQNEAIKKVHDWFASLKTAN